jgi:hypothetical protein
LTSGCSKNIDGLGLSPPWILGAIEIDKIGIFLSIEGKCRKQSFYKMHTHGLQEQRV